MNAHRFGPTLTDDGVTFSLWAPAAKTVDVFVNGDSCDAKRIARDGFPRMSQEPQAGARYKFRIDDELDVPDPASQFQPDDISGPSEIIDHACLPLAR